MTRLILRQKAIELRKKGKTYSEIKTELEIPKTTLSDWLRTYPLTEKEILLLTAARKKSRLLAIEKTRITKQKKRDERIKLTYEYQKKELLPLTKKELLVAGLFLYWGEGQKRMPGYIGISNTNPKIVKFSLFWLTSILKIPKTKIHVLVHLYSDMNIPKEISYWSTFLNLKKSQFRKPYIKTSKQNGLTYKSFGHGTCTLAVSDILLKEKIMMGIEAIADYYCDN